MTEKSTKAKNTPSGTILERVRRGLPRYLFNRRVLSLPQVTVAEIASVAGTSHGHIDDQGRYIKGKPVSRLQVYRWLSAMHLDKKSEKAGLVEPTSYAIGQWCTKELPYEVAYRLYRWSLKRRFDLQGPSKQGYRKASPEARKARREAREKAKAKHAEKQESTLEVPETPFKAVEGASGSLYQKLSQKPAESKRESWEESSQSFSSDSSMSFFHKPQEEPKKAPYEASEGLSSQFTGQSEKSAVRSKKEPKKKRPMSDPVGLERLSGYKDERR